MVPTFIHTNKFKYPTLTAIQMQEPSHEILKTGNWWELIAIQSLEDGHKPVRSGLYPHPLLERMWRVFVFIVK